MSQQLPCILLVEDEPSLHESLKLNLEMEGYEVASAFDGAIAIQMIEAAWYDLVILDIMLPSLDGFSILEWMRLAKIESKVLVLSARSASSDRIKGLKTGADDYLSKPFELEELLLRVAKLVHLSGFGKGEIGSEQYVFGGHAIDFKAQVAHLVNGNNIGLSKKEAMLLKLLIDHANEVVTRERILQVVWGYQVYPTTRTIDNFILNFRKYFEADSRHPMFFHSVRSMGYKFTP